MSEDVLISIHPEHVAAILAGAKFFEYRKSAPKNVKRMFIYATAPISKIVAVAHVSNTLRDTPGKIWKSTRHGGGIKLAHFNQYYRERKLAFAFQISQVDKLVQPINPKTAIPKIAVPQSYRFLTEKESKLLTTQPITTAKKTIIFLGGVHGSGKTTLGKILEKKFGFFSLTASAVIRLTGGEIRQDKAVIKVVDNQQRLIDGLKALRTNKSRIALDGHFCLIDTEGRVSEIPIETYKAIDPSYIIHVTTTIATIRRRLEARETPLPKNLNLSDYIASDNRRAKEVATLLNIPLITVDTGEKTNEIARTLKPTIEMLLRPHSTRNECIIHEMHILQN